MGKALSDLIASLLFRIRSIERARTLDLFHDNPTDLPDAEICGDRHLLTGACIRDAVHVA